MQILVCWNHAGTILAVTFGDTVFLLQILLTDRDERPHTAGYLSFKTLLV